MDAYDIYQRIKYLWSIHCDKHSGILNHKSNKMSILIHTEEGFREIVDVVYDENLKAIILIKDKE